MWTQRQARDGGGINLVKIALVLVVIAIGYFAYIYVPIITDHFGMKKAVRVAANVAYTSHGSVKAVKNSIMNSYKELNMQDEYLDLNDNSIKKTPTPFSEDDITVEFSDSPRQVTVSVHYARHVVWPFLNQEKTLEYEIDHQESLESIKW